MILIGKTVVFDENKDEFEVVSHVGSGGFGEIYKVKGIESGDVYAIKTMKTQGMNEDEYDALVNEASMSMGIDHRNVLKYHYFHDGQTHSGLPPYIMMDYASNGSLREFIDNKRKNNDPPLSDDSLLNMTLQILEGAKAVNSKILHRDFHPGNILLNDGMLKVTDFGLSKVVDAVTRSNTFKGTTHFFYKAPESWRGESNKVQLDMYAVGITLYELATFNYPYEYRQGGQLIDIQNMHLLGRPQSAKRFNPNLSGIIEEIISKLMRKDVSDRFGSWEEAITLLKENNQANLDIDISGVVNAARGVATDRENAVIEAKRIQSENENRMNIFRYSVDELMNEIAPLVDKLNESSSAIELSLVKHGSINNGFEVKNNESFLSKISFICYPAREVKESMKVNVFGMDRMRIVTPRYRGKELMGWGTVSVKSDYSGFNLLLLRESEDDIYGKWYVMQNKVSSLVRHPQEVCGKQRQDAFTLKSDIEFYEQLGITAGNVTSVIDSTVTKFDLQLIADSIKDIL